MEKTLFFALYREDRVVLPKDMLKQVMEFSGSKGSGSDEHLAPDFITEAIEMLERDGPDKIERGRPNVMIEIGRNGSPTIRSVYELSMELKREQCFGPRPEHGSQAPR